MTDRADGAGSTPATGAGCPDTADLDSRTPRTGMASQRARWWRSWPGSWATATTTTSSRARRQVQQRCRPGRPCRRHPPPGPVAAGRDRGGRHGVDGPGPTALPGHGPAAASGGAPADGAGPARLRSRAGTKPASNARRPKAASHQLHPIPRGQTRFPTGDDGPGARRPRGRRAAKPAARATRRRASNGHEASVGLPGGAGRRPVPPAGVPPRRVRVIELAVRSFSSPSSRPSAGRPERPPCRSATSPRPTTPTPPGASRAPSTRSSTTTTSACARSPSSLRAGRLRPRHLHP
jgi:hypothetical protein